METLTYILSSKVTLEQISKVVQRANYLTETVVLERPQLNVYFTRDKTRWCYIVRAIATDTLYETEAAGKQFEALQPVTVFFLFYHVSELDEIAKLLKFLLEQYGGVVDCKGTYDRVFDISTIHRIVYDCP